MTRVWLAICFGLVCLIGAAAVASLVSTQAQAQAQAQAGGDPASVIAAFEMARNRRDIDTALTYFADDAVVSVRNTQYNGRDEIRKYLDGPITRSRFVVVSDRRASGTRVTWTERPGTQSPTTGLGQAQGPANPGNNVTVNNNAAFTVSVEATVQDGKIHSLSYLAGGQAARIDPSLEGRAQLPATVGLGAVLLVLLGVVIVASLGLRRPGPGDSTLRGRLMQDLRGWSSARQSL